MGIIVLVLAAAIFPTDAKHCFEFITTKSFNPKAIVAASILTTL
jgi:hypothetical protein